MLILLVSQTYVPIDSIQRTVIAGTDSSIFVGQTVMTSGIVVEVGKYGKGFHIVMKQGGPYSGIFVYLLDTTGMHATISRGDSVNVIGTVSEWYGFTEISASNISAVSVISSNHEYYVDTVNIVDVSNANVDVEMYEGVIVYIDSASVVDVNHTYRYTLSDGSAFAYLLKKNIPPLAQGDNLRLTAILVYEFGEYRLLARDSLDVEFILTAPTSPYIPIDSIQRTMKPNTDSSAFVGQLVRTSGIVSEVGNYGNGFHIIMSRGGPYSGIYVYTNDFANYIVGDSVEVEGIVKEFYGYTEIEPISIIKLSSGKSFYIDTVSTRTLSSSNPDSAEMYEGVLVHVKDAVVLDISNNYRYTISNSELPAYLSKDNLPGLLNNDVVSFNGVLTYEFGEYRLYNTPEYTLTRFPYKLEGILYSQRTDVGFQNSDSIGFIFKRFANPSSDMNITFSIDTLDMFQGRIQPDSPDSLVFFVSLKNLQRGYYDAKLSMIYNNDTLSITFKLPYPNGFSCVLINEFDDYPTDDEFVEIINKCPYDVNIGGLRVISYAGTNVYTSSHFPSVVLKPESVFVLAYSPQRCSGISNCIALEDWTYFNSYQPMAIITPLGFAVDGLYYEFYWGGRDPYTTIRVSYDAYGWTRQAWGPSSIPSGTPGRANEISVPSKPKITFLKKDVVRGELLHIAFTLPDNSSDVYVYLYDDAGRYIDRIYYERNYAVGGGSATYDTSNLKPGIYFIVIVQKNEVVSRAIFRVRRR